jgi:hypothetical protein
MTEAADLELELVPCDSLPIGGSFETVVSVDPLLLLAAFQTCERT